MKYTEVQPPLAPDIGSSFSISTLETSIGSQLSNFGIRHGGLVFPGSWALGPFPSGFSFGLGLLTIQPGDQSTRVLGSV